MKKLRIEKSIKHWHLKLSTDTFIKGGLASKVKVLKRNFINTRQLAQSNYKTNTRLIIYACEISGFHNNEYEYYHLSRFEAT
jgi:hypothetical protein